MWTTLQLIIKSLVVEDKLNAVCKWRYYELLVLIYGRIHSQYVHDHTKGPAVHRSAISLSPNNLWGWLKKNGQGQIIYGNILWLPQSAILIWTNACPCKQKIQFALALILLLLFHLLHLPRECFVLKSFLPRYSGVPQGSLMSPFSSFARWKSLMTIFECFSLL